MIIRIKYTSLEVRNQQRLVLLPGSELLWQRVGGKEVRVSNFMEHTSSQGRLVIQARSARSAVVLS